MSIGWNTRGNDVNLPNKPEIHVVSAAWLVVGIDFPTLVQMIVFALF